MRVQTEGEYAYRGDVIEDTADFWECNKTDAVVRSCDLAGRVLPQLVDAIEAADIRPSEKEKLVDALNTPNVSIGYKRENISIRPETGDTKGDVRELGIVSETVLDNNEGLRALINEIAADFSGRAPLEEVLARAEDEGIRRGQTKQEIENLKEQGDVYEPEEGWLRTS